MKFYISSKTSYLITPEAVAYRLERAAYSEVEISIAMKFFKSVAILTFESDSIRVEVLRNDNSLELYAFNRREPRRLSERRFKAEIALDGKPIQLSDSIAHMYQ